MKYLLKNTSSYKAKSSPLCSLEELYLGGILNNFVDMRNAFIRAITSDPINSIFKDIGKSMNFQNLKILSLRDCVKVSDILIRNLAQNNNL